jgi:hypothetical protein
MLLVKDFKITLYLGEHLWEARAWNAHCEFICDSDSPHAALDKAIRGCLEYHVARIFEAAYVVRVGTKCIVYENLACQELRKKTSPREWGVYENFADVFLEDKPVRLEFACENCHGFQIMRVKAVRFPAKVPPGS